MMRRNGWLSLALGGLGSMALLLGLAGCGEASCESGSQTYADGARWTCDDGCNGCWCEDGTISSTDMLCAAPPGPAAGKLICEEGESTHRHADTWTCENGCRCSCDDGDVIEAAGC